MYFRIRNISPGALLESFIFFLCTSTEHFFHFQNDDGTRNTFEVPHRDLPVIAVFWFPTKDNKKMLYGYKGNKYKKYVYVYKNNY